MIVGLIGCGFIGQTIAKFIDTEMQDDMELSAVYDDVREYAVQISQALRKTPRVADLAESIVSDDSIQLIIEAASQKAAKLYVPKSLEAGKDVLLMSVGALADKMFLETILSTARRQKRRIYIPSGAIGGLDWIKAASQAGLSKVTITTRKPPLALDGSPYVVKHGINLSSIQTPKQIYEGPAIEAAALFPANINVAVTLSLAGIGPEKTLVRVIADPTITQNIHEIVAEGATGKITVRVENLASPTNPKTSWIAALSANEKLKQIVNPMSLGT